MNQRLPIRTALLGFALADALGVPYEFLDRNEMDETPATGITGYGTHNQRPGTWSDDTSMALCVIENLIEDGDDANLSEKFLRWYEKDHYTAHGVLFDIGIQTRKSLYDIRQNGFQRRNSGFDSQDAGNGALMRVFPYAFLPNLEEAIPLMLHDIRITHPSSISTECCLFFVHFLRKLLDGSSKEQALQHTVAFMQERTVFEAFGHDQYPTKFMSRLTDSMFASTDRKEIFSSGFAVHTLEASIWCFLNSSSYKEAVLTAVNLGNDTDTVAAISGVMAAVHYGEVSIPKEWMEQLQAKTLLEEIVLEW
jgi:ADP-ribosyl-[dinitrogen reductase] hydrolase